MQAVIIAAGKGTRMKELSVATPKPMLTIKGKNLIEYKLDILPPEIDEVIMVVGHLGDQIVSHFGDSHNGRNIKYVWQKELKGTCDALWQAEPLLTGRFIVMMGDDIYDREEVAAALEHPWSLLARRVPGPRTKGGRIILGEDGIISDILEGEHEIEPGQDFLMNTGFYVLQKELFKYEPVQIPGRQEWGLPQTLVKAIKDGHSVATVESRRWIPITSPEDLKSAEQYL
jgi:UDP-N-acetylglucosamine diphosphorylase / glucose-1-phosphate thymidylyltransferase / UDP-N-acetylgalactosamine diphosphorylase / glucosamine-1-phosphate N-acetyltransferase / galactosamine-1-phosphate N-acetyltransferase